MTGRPAPPAVRTPWGAVLTLARLELRQRWRSVLAFGLAAATMTGGVLAVATIEWRTDSAYPRLVDRSGLADVQVALVHQAARPAQLPAAIRRVDAAVTTLRSRPEVAASMPLSTFVGRVRGPGRNYVSITAPQRPYAELGVPVIVRGAAPGAGDPTAVVIEESRARAFGVRVGDRLTLGLLTPAQFLQFSTGIGAPAGPGVTVHVVGLFRYPAPGQVYNSLVASPAFAREYGTVAVGRTLLLRTSGHRPAPALQAAIGRLDRELTARFGAGQLPYLAAEQPRRFPDPGLGPTRAVLRFGLLALAAVVLVAGLILSLQSAGRWAERGRESQQVEAVLGLRRRERLAARLLAALPAVLLAAAGGVTGALAGAAAEPLGSLRRYEPDPGWLPNPALAAVGALAGAAAVAAATALAAGSVTRTGSVRPRPHTTRSAGPRPRLVLLAGALAARRGGPATAMPVRSVTLALAAMLAGFVLVLDLHTQLSGVAAAPARWGWTADFQVQDDTPQLDARLAADPRVRDVEQVTSTSLSIRSAVRSADLPVYGRTTLRGRLPWTVAAGRVPTRSGEIALGPRAAHDLGVAVGDSVRLSGPRRTAAPLRVVGVVIVPPGNREPLGRNALLTREQLLRLTAVPPYSGVFVRGTDAVATRVLRAELGPDQELEDAVAPDTVTALDELARPTRILLAVLALGALLLIVQGLRLLMRRRRSQLAVAHTLGLDLGALRLAVAGAAVGGTAVAAVIGVPLGWAGCRLVLHEVGPRLGLALAGPGVAPALLTATGAVLLTTLLAFVTSRAAVTPRRLFGRRE